MHVEIPRIGSMLRHAGPRLLEGTVVPLTIFLLALRLLGPAGAMAAGLVWAYGLIALRRLVGRPVPGLLLLGAVTLTARTVIAAATGSTVVYFLQPSLGTALVATAFLVSVPLGHPLAGRLARDLCPLPAELTDHAGVQLFFRRVTLLWAAAQFANALVSVWLLLTQSVGTFVVARSAASFGITLSAIVASTLWFRFSMRRHGIRVTLAEGGRCRARS